MKKMALALGSMLATQTSQTTEINQSFGPETLPSHYWDALILVANGNIEKAKEIIAAQDNSMQSPFARKAKNVRDLMDIYFAATLACSPQYLTSLGLFEQLGITDHNLYLDSMNISERKKATTFQNKPLEQLDTIPTVDQERVDRAYLSWIRDMNLQAEPYILHDFQMTQLFGVVQALAYTFVDEQQLKTENDIKIYISRLQAIAPQIIDTIELMKVQTKANIVPPRFTIEKVLKIIDNFRPTDINSMVLYKHLAEKVTELKLAAEYLEQAEDIVKNQLYPALAQLHSYSESLLAHTHMNGVWALPKGPGYYQATLAYHTTTNLDPATVHEIGLREVATIQNDMAQLLAQEGIDCTPSESGKRLPAYFKAADAYFENSAEGRKECLQELETILARCRKELHPLFSQKPKAGVIIKPVPQEQQNGASLAYYCLPSADGSRPGAFNINLADMNAVNKYQLESLVVHEAEPGHHFQIALQQEQSPTALQKFKTFNAFAEGWGLYTERLAYEQNFYSSAKHKLGYLQWALLRAARLVLDTGIHFKKWSYEQAIDYMKEVTGMEDTLIVSEIERYFVMPGQACSYKIGELKILELRERAKEKLGTKFQIQEFHDVVISYGSVPLAVLEQNVDNYISKKLEA